ncbi:hypothetical protein A1O7_08103 [Cladophialophora yegresii CBS 114405]|uniref:Cell wall mannoprotein PIR1-like C-terminal domain-containing protein n=1 Tax=Cladophialophora yegresii CBS 114405 TaxID=1182544 RepID=W9VI52_9EURO|nr:uncharacterized protein A1O7_08103 [Cladophialophora yegresii CBS 114405]EXJ55178.1 hypothetical protein A1O7_08103 [Cladophialophora yegresii CBS 114405]
MNISLPSPSSTPSQTLQRRQQPPSPIFTVGTVDQIDDGQVQGRMHTVPISIEITATSSSVAILPPVTQIGDGQIQGPMATTGQASSPTTVTICSSSRSPFPPLATTSKPPSVIEQACGISRILTSPTPISTTVAIQPQRGSAFSSYFNPGTSIYSASAGSITTNTSSRLISAAVQSLSTSTASSPPAAASSSSSAAAAAPSPFASESTTDDLPTRLSLVSCLTNSTLRLHLQDNNLFDGLDRTGYIASNYQFQFDGPPQSGAIYTSGWSVCPVSTSRQQVEDGASDSTRKSDGNGNGDSNDEAAQDGVMTLALGPSTTFWQCLSGDFYNLYTENWAAQCSPVELRITRLVECG